MLGPLCVGCCAFELERHDPDRGAPDLWRLLGSAVCRSPSDRRHRLAIADSKKLKRHLSPGAAGHPLQHLERGVLSFCRAVGVPTVDDVALFDHLEAQVPPHPWYDSTSPLPLAHQAVELDLSAGVLKRTMDAAGVRCVLLACRMIPAEELNSQVDKMGTKASVNLCSVMWRIEALWRRWPESHPRVVVDRLGGRIHYRRALSVCFPDARIRVLAEGPALSRYRLRRNGSLLTVSFGPHAEDTHLPVALASMIAKYVRDLMMLRMNRFFGSLLPELKPTAGYVTDARRYLDQIGPLMKRLGISPSQLIRQV